MIVKLENREYELKANGSFMKKYQETFNENMMMALYKGMREKDMYECAKLTYCAITETDQSFDEWLDSFETPTFILTEMEEIFKYLIRECTPTVEPAEKEGKTSSKKKTNN